MYLELKDWCEMPDCESSEKAKQLGKFPMVRVILDCTEIYTEKPSSLQANKAIYSHYKDVSKGGSHGAKTRFLNKFSCCFYHLL